MDDSLVFKIIVLGQQGVGKSSMLIRYIKGQFSQHYNVTVGVQFASKAVEVDQKTTVKLQIWDTAGQQAFRAIVKSFYKGISAVFLVYGIDNDDSFQALKSWLKQVKENSHEEVVFFLVGSRLDLQANRKISHEKANTFLKQIGAVFFIETSAKTGTNIEQLFNRAAKILHKKYISNSSFRDLVKPVLASGFQPQRADSFTINENRMTLQKKKKKVVVDKFIKYIICYINHLILYQLFFINLFKILYYHFQNFGYLLSIEFICQFIFFFLY